MADLEKQKIVIELRKFRKKLRQIEKLEELERDLTEEEFLKLSKKDEVRSKVQELVARDEELSFELQNMESVGKQDEQTSSNEQEEEANIPVTVQSHAEETSQEVISENVQSENDQVTLNEIYNQAPELTCPRVAEVDTVNTAVTREPLMSSSNRTYMKFFVRNLEGHNDVICDVACAGSVLVSGRAVERSEIRLRLSSGDMDQGNQEQPGSSSESDQDHIKSENNAVSPCQHQLQLTTYKQSCVNVEGNVKTEIVDNRMMMQVASNSVVSQDNQEQLASSSKSDHNNSTAENKDMSPCHVEMQQSVIREIVENKMMMPIARNSLMDSDTQEQLASSSDPDGDHPKAENKEMSTRHAEMQQSVIRESVENKMMTQVARNSHKDSDTQEQLASTSDPDGDHPKTENKEMSTRHAEMQQSVIRETVENKMMTQIARNSHMDSNTQEQPASSCDPDGDHPRAENNEISLWQHQQQNVTCNQREENEITEIVDNGMIMQADGIQDQPPSTSKSGQGHSQNKLASSSTVDTKSADQLVMAMESAECAMPDLDQITRTQETQTAGEVWKYIKFSTRNLTGHNDLICAIDCHDSILVSAGRDTMLKLWDADTGREMRSMGGHTGTITSVFLLPKKDISSCDVPSSFRTDQYSVLTGSKDCSMKIWSLSSGQIKRSMYAFSPVECLDCTSNLTAAGLDGGKVELWDLETGTTVRSVRGHDEDAVTAVKDDRVISGSATGVVKVWDIRDNSLKPVMSSDQAPVDQADAGVTIKPRRVRCLATTEETVYWGDDGVNIKAMDLNSGKLRKIRNHVAQFGSTGAMATAGSCLVSAGYDLDRGNGYLNVRSLPSEEYMATVNDESTGTITCLSCTQTTRDQVTLHRMCTGGVELKLWDQLPSSMVKKRARPETDDVYVTAKHVRRYSQPDISDTESSEDEDDQPEGEDSDDDDDISTTGSTSRSWCTIS